MGSRLCQGIHLRLVHLIAVNRDHVGAQHAMHPGEVELRHSVNPLNKVPLTKTKVGGETKTSCISALPEPPQQFRRRGRQPGRRHHGLNPAARTAVPALRQSVGLLKLLVANCSIENCFTPRERFQIDVVHHHANLRPHATGLDKGSEKLGILLHLQNCCHAASQELSHGECADDLAFFIRDHPAHWQIKAVCRGMPDILGSPAKYSVAHMIVRADKTRQHDFSVAVYHGIRCRIPLTQCLGLTHGRDAVLLDIDRSVFNDAACRINRHNRSVGDQQ